MHVYPRICLCVRVCLCVCVRACISVCVCECVCVHLVEVLLSDAAVLQVQDAVECLDVQQVHLLQVLQHQRDATQLLPHQRSQMQVQRFLGADGHAHQDAQEFKLQQMLIQTC